MMRRAIEHEPQRWRARMKRRMMAVSLGILMSTVCGASLSPAKDKICGPEMEKFCKGVAVGEGHILKCLQEHRADLSAECKAYVNTASQYIACVDDVMQLCPGTQPGSGEAMVCLRTHQGDLSEGCKYALQKAGR
jgi:hypothetical protein